MNEPQPFYQFLGMSPYVDIAAKSLGLVDERMKGKARNIEHLARIQTALGQATRAGAEDRQAIFSQALDYRASLATALLAAELAIFDVATAVGLDSPNFAELGLDLASAHQSASDEIRE